MRNAILSMLDRTRTAQLKFAEGKSQHTLQKNRAAALEVALALIDGECPQPEAIEAARAPIASLLSKSEKSMSHFAPDRWQYKMLYSNITALRHAQTLMNIKTEETKQ